MLTTLNKLLNVKPKGFQVEGIRFILDNPYCFLGDDMGLGKSLQALSACLISGGTTLIICPTSLKENWKQELIKLCKKTPSITIIKDSKNIHEPFDADFTIISYDLMKDAKARVLVQWATNVILDEAHLIKHLPQGKEVKDLFNRTYVIHELIYEEQPKRVINLSGTPMENRVDETYAPIRLMDYHYNTGFLSRYPSLASFQNRFMFRKTVYLPDDRKINKFEGFRNKDIHRQLWRKHYLRRTSKDKLDIPREIFKDVYVDYLKDDKALLKEWNDFQNKKDKGSPAKKKSALLKTKFTANYAMDIAESGQGKVLLFTDHPEAAEALATRLKCDFIHGGSTDRQGKVNKFQNGSADYLVMTIGIAYGFNITAAKHVIFNDESWIPPKNEQAIARAVRMGQLDRVVVHKVIGSRQDKHIQDMNKKKLEDIQEVV